MINLNNKISVEQKEKNKKAVKDFKAQQKKSRERAKKTIENYKSFAIKGNAIDLAIGVVIGSAFTNIVNAIVSSTITPLISILTNKVDLSKLFISLSGGKFDTLEQAKLSGAITLNYGELLNALLNFFIVSFVLFLIVSFIRKSNKKNAKKEADFKESRIKTCPYCLNEIPKDAIRCGYCTSKLANEPLTTELLNEESNS